MTTDRLSIRFADECFGDSADISDMKQMFREFALELRIRDLTPKTQKGYLERVRYFGEFLSKVADRNLFSVDRHIIRDYILNLKDRNLSNISINGYLKVLNVFFSYLDSEGLWNGSPNPMVGVKLLPVPRIQKHVLKPDEIKRVLAVPDRKSFFGLRTYCMLLVFYDTAIRLNELRGIKLEDISIDSGTIKVMGKGRKERTASFGALTAKWLNRYLTQYRSRYPGEYLFSTKRGKRILESTIQRTLRRVGERVGLNLSPHLLRHSAATHRAQAGMPAFLLQRFLGHSSVRTTERYVHIAEDADQLEAFRRYSPLDGILRK